MFPDNSCGFSTVCPRNHSTPRSIELGGPISNCLPEEAFLPHCHTVATLQYIQDGEGGLPVGGPAGGGLGPGRGRLLPALPGAGGDTRERKGMKRMLADILPLSFLALYFTSLSRLTCPKKTNFILPSSGNITLRAL